MTYKNIIQLQQENKRTDIKYKIGETKFNLFLRLDKGVNGYKVNLNIAYFLKINVNNVESMVILSYSKVTGFDFVYLDEIFKYPSAVYQVTSTRIINQKYKTHPFFKEMKSNLTNINKEMFSLKNDKFVSLKNQLKIILLENLSKDVFTKLTSFNDDVFEKNKFPKELNHKGRKLSIKKDTNIVEFIERYAFGHRQLMLFGEKGIGKTYTIRQVVDKNNWKMVKIDGHSGLDEYSLLGHLIRTPDGSFRWKNGSLAQAFREASQGTRVVVFIDEILRMNPQTLNLLITAMDPYDGYYELELDNPIEDQNSKFINGETLKAPMQNLWFICATNIGANYEVSTMDEAFKDRFILKQIEISLEEIKIIITNKLAEKNIDYAAENIMSFYSKLHNLFLSKMISHDINLRHVTDIIEYANSANDFKILFKDKMFAWVGLNYNGEPIEDEISIIKNAIDTLL